MNNITTSDQDDFYTEVDRDLDNAIDAREAALADYRASSDAASAATS
jgi:hypothetical protein